MPKAFLYNNFLCEGIISLTKRQKSAKNKMLITVNRQITSILS